jgi:protein SCO1/2
MKYLNLLILLLVLAILPSWAIAQHSDHSNSNALDAAGVNHHHSLFQMDAEWINHRGEHFQLTEFQGQPVIITMFYGNCTQVCPILIRDAKRLYEAVDETLQKNVQVLAVSFDTENDTVDALYNYAEAKNLNQPNWHFVTGARNNIRELAMLLGVQYSKKSDGHFAHSNLVTLLDGDGMIVSRLEGLNQPVDEAVRIAEEYLESKGEHQTTVHKH